MAKRIWAESLSASPGDTILLEIRIDSGVSPVDCFGFDFCISDLTRLHYLGYSEGSFRPAEGWDMFGVHRWEDGRIRVAGFSAAHECSGDGNIVTLEFLVLNNDGTDGCLLNVNNLVNDISGYDNSRPGHYYYREPPGDVNEDGAITSEDAQLAFKIALGIITPTDAEFIAADFDRDGVVTAGDAAAIFKKAMGL